MECEQLALAHSSRLLAGGRASPCSVAERMRPRFAPLLPPPAAPPLHFALFVKGNHQSCTDLNRRGGNAVTASLALSALCGIWTTRPDSKQAGKNQREQAQEVARTRSRSRSPQHACACLLDHGKPTYLAQARIPVTSKKRAFPGGGPGNAQGCRTAAERRERQGRGAPGSRPPHAQQGTGCTFQANDEGISVALDWPDAGGACRGRYSG